MSIDTGQDPSSRPPAAAVSTWHLDYLLRRFDPPALASLAALPPAVPLALRRLWHVRGVGVTVRCVPVTTRAALVGLYGYKVPVSFLLCSPGASQGGISVQFGTWSVPAREFVDDAVLDARAELLRSVIGSLHPTLDAVRAPAAAPILPWPCAGLVLGHPRPAVADAAAVTQTETGLQVPTAVDRLLWGMSGSTGWSALVLADPVDESAVIHMRNLVLNELRVVAAQVESKASAGALADLYATVLRRHLLLHTVGQGEGAWRAAVYLLGDQSSFHRLATVWRSVFFDDGTARDRSGHEEELGGEPLRVVQDCLAAHLAADWSLPDVRAQAGPGRFHHLFAYQSLLTSGELAGYLQVPSAETSGFAVRAVPLFDCVPATERAGEGERVVLGDVVERGVGTGTPYTVRRSMLNRHALVAGVTGAGKTNTVFAVLRQLCRQGVPFLVVEPAKTEYRALFDDDAVGPRLRVFTLGQEAVAPLRLNPLEFEPHVAVGMHIDLLKSVFNASFGMWTPLPQILERCLHQVYLDQGWDPTWGGNHRLMDAGAAGCTRAATSSWDPWSMPTLTQLSRRVEETVEGLGYDERVTSDLKAALLTRLDSLRVGAKGAMLDTHQSIPIEELLSAPTVIELEGIGDDDEKSFLMGLILVRIYEHLRAQPVREGTGLTHLTVVEEAHRLLPDLPATVSAEHANMRGRAVETFVSMLSEVRAYGEGVLVAEQIPSKLAPDVLKSTNLKVVHRTVAETERRALGGTMNMDESQIAMLAMLETGQAAVFAEGDDRPLIIDVPYVKPASSQVATKHASDARVASRMLPLIEGAGSAYLPHPLCPAACRSPYRFCDATRPVVESAAARLQFSGLVLAAALAGPQQLSAHTASVLALLRARLPSQAQCAGGYRCAVLQGADAYVADRGRAYGWGYELSRRLRQGLAALVDASMTAVLEGGDQPDPEPFARLYAEACRRPYDPYPACARVCPNEECLFRHHLTPLVSDHALAAAFTAAMARAGRTGAWSEVGMLDDVVARLDATDLPAQHRRSLALCYGVQQIAAMPGLLDAARRLAVADLIDGYESTERVRHVRDAGAGVGC